MKTAFVPLIMQFDRTIFQLIKKKKKPGTIDSHRMQLLAPLIMFALSFPHLLKPRLVVAIGANKAEHCEDFDVETYMLTLSTVRTEVTRRPRGFKFSVYLRVSC